MGKSGPVQGVGNFPVVERQIRAAQGRHQTPDHMDLRLGALSGQPLVTADEDAVRRQTVPDTAQQALEIGRRIIKRHRTPDDIVGAAEIVAIVIAADDVDALAGLAFEVFGDHRRTGRKVEQMYLHVGAALGNGLT